MGFVGVKSFKVAKMLCCGSAYRSTGTVVPLNIRNAFGFILGICLI
jgi:hypothetical protein